MLPALGVAWSANGRAGTDSLACREVPARKRLGTGQPVVVLGLCSWVVFVGHLPLRGVSEMRAFPMGSLGPWQKLPEGASCVTDKEEAGGSVAFPTC